MRVSEIMTCFASSNYLCHHSTLQDLSDTHRLLLRILEMEKQITSEVRALSQLKIYPSNELLVIRNGAKLITEGFRRGELEEEEKDRNAVKCSISANSVRKSDASSALERSHLLLHQVEANALLDAPYVARLEYLLTKKKLSVLAHRRGVEQEAREIEARRVAKYRAVQESHAKYPPSFSYSSKY